jgi:hypothetical protein
VRAILPAGLWAVLTVLRVGAADAQINADSVQTVTRDTLEPLLATYAPAQETRWHRSPTDPFTIVGYFAKNLKYAERFEIVLTVTDKATIWFRVYPQWGGDYINLDKVRDASGLMQKLLRFSYHNFFFWGADDALDVFAGYQCTLESGFPEEAIKVVIRSVPLLDEDVGEVPS